MTTHQCSKCFRELPRSMFSADRRVKSGLQKRCKECVTLHVRRYRSKNRDMLIEKDRERAQLPKRKAQLAKADAKRRGLHGEKLRARKKVYRALQDGYLKKNPCVFCQSADVEAHHADYLKPLDVIWVCGTCHREKFHPRKEH